jgi:hypothetical protein
MWAFINLQLAFFHDRVMKKRVTFNLTVHNSEQCQASADMLRYLDSSEFCNLCCQCSPVIPFKEGNHVTAFAAPHATKSASFIEEK